LGESKFRRRRPPIALLVVVIRVGTPEVGGATLI
jgi:hypothetical protein